jgi:hypothetical protein
MTNISQILILPYGNGILKLRPDGRIVLPLDHSKASEIVQAMSTDYVTIRPANLAKFAPADPSDTHSALTWLNQIDDRAVCSPVYINIATNAEFLPTGRIKVLLDTEETLTLILSTYSLLKESVPAIAGIYRPKVYARLRVTPASPGNAVQVSSLIKSQIAGCEFAEPECFQPAIPL